MNVQPLTVGPILGAVTGQSARLLGRGDDAPEASILAGIWNGFRTRILRQPPSPPYRLGVIRIRAIPGSSFQPPQFFKLDPTFDLTGIAVLGNLRPIQRYEYQMGWIVLPRNQVEGRGRAAIANAASPNPDPSLDLNTIEAQLQALSLNWSAIPTYAFQTASTDPQEARSFILGSCRYLLRLFGGSFFDDRGDVTFQSALQQVDQGLDTHGLLMVGDQIYADDLNALGADRTVDEFLRRYRDSFTQPGIRTLMAKLPTYMTLDDHEIEDNWPSNATQKDWVTLFPIAIHAYTTYQLSHSPLFSLAQGEVSLDDAPTQLWYTFQDGCCDFFITDTRTERQLTTGDDRKAETATQQAQAQDRKIISDEQLAALKQWLANRSGRIKLIASAVPFFPDLKTLNLDKWSGFLQQRTELLDFIAEQQISPVIFLSGDVHCSMTAELRCPQQENFQVISVISSAFFWPYPHTQGSSFQLEGSLASLSDRTFEVAEAGPVCATDNFTRVTITPTSLKAEVFSRKGELCGTKVHSFKQ